MNFVALYGTLSQDPDFKNTQSGISVCNMIVVTKKNIKTRDGTFKDVFENHRVVTWGKTAELCGKHLRAGSKVMVRGEIRTDSYEKDGKKMYATKIQADEVSFGESGEQRYRTKSEEPHYDWGGPR
jgi:single-strand DNA-binding protein